MSDLSYDELGFLSRPQIWAAQALLPLFGNQKCWRWKTFSYLGVGAVTLSVLHGFSTIGFSLVTADMSTHN